MLIAQGYSAYHLWNRKGIHFNEKVRNFFKSQAELTFMFSVFDVRLRRRQFLVTRISGTIIALQRSWRLFSSIECFKRRFMVRPFRIIDDRNLGFRISVADASTSGKLLLKINFTT